MRTQPGHHARATLGDVPTELGPRRTRFRHPEKMARRPCVPGAGVGVGRERAPLAG
jgi:hypothetical protein